MKSGDTMQIKWTVSALNDLASEMDYPAKEAEYEIAGKAYIGIQEKISNLKKSPAREEKEEYLEQKGLFLLITRI